MNRHYLIIASGESYDTRIASEAGLVDGIASLLYDQVTDMPEDERADWQKSMDDEDEWQTDTDAGKVHFSTEMGDMVHINIHLIQGLACLGAVPNTLEFIDPAPECPFQHLMHTDSAGPNPTLLFGFPNPVMHHPNSPQK